MSTAKQATEAMKTANEMRVVIVLLVAVLGILGWFLYRDWEREKRAQKLAEEIAAERLEEDRLGNEMRKSDSELRKALNEITENQATLLARQAEELASNAAANREQTEAIARGAEAVCQAIDKAAEQIADSQNQR